MTRLPNRISLTYAFVALTSAAQCRADFAVFTGTGAGWLQAVPNHQTIGFNEFPDDTLIGEQYASMGVHFTDVDGNWIIANVPGTYLQDGCGLNGNQFVELTFDTPISAFASYFPGIEFFSFFLGARKLFDSALMGGSGLNHFAGFTTDTPFDRVVLHSLPPNSFGVIHKVFLDDIYFGSIPSPAGFPTIVAAIALVRSRRKRSG
jgi:hypothetical protein